MQRGRGPILSSVGGQMTPASRSPTIAAPQPPTWTPLDRCPLKPSMASHVRAQPRSIMVLGCSGADAGQQGLGEGCGSTAGHAPSSWAACVLSQAAPNRSRGEPPWMTASLPTGASALVSCLIDDGSPPPTLMGGGRSSLGRRRDLRLPRLSLAGAQSNSRSPIRFP
jgi:hypothetical protein